MLLRQAPRSSLSRQLIDQVATGRGRAEWSPGLRRFRKQIAAITAASTALLWVDNLSEHCASP
jgi:hypothetical protein